MVQDWVQVKAKPAKVTESKSRTSIVGNGLNWLRLLPSSDTSLKIDFVQLPKLKVSGCRNFAECGFALAKILPCTAFSLKSNDTLDSFGLSCGVLQLSDVPNWAELVIKGSKPSLCLVRNEPAGRLQDFLYFVLGPAILAKWERVDKDVFLFQPITTATLADAIKNAKARSVLSNLSLGTETPAKTEKEDNAETASADELSAPTAWQLRAAEKEQEKSEDYVQYPSPERSSSWLRCVTNGGSVFYYHPETQLIRWSQTSKAPLGSGLYLEPPITETGEVKSWVSCVTPQGVNYWYNPLEGFVTWKKPQSDDLISTESLKSFETDV
eukprot:GHVL01034635.1.p1 GENE.GHVL01034635.1~~GHVL01034635.1.p1  ORF type:complete len:325 (+),score=45.83 GHVL01034635.1:42-1016(+)